MNRKLVSLCSLTVLLTFVISIALEVHVVKASGTIYIRSDGSIEPSDAPLSTNDNVTYSLVSNVTSNADGIVIERDNIRLHGVSYILQGTGAQNYYIGIDLAGRKNVAIEKIEIKAFSIGIRLDSCSNNIISGNIVTKHNYDGIRLLRGSNNNVVFRNILTDNNPNIRLDFSSNYNTIYGN
ncbi:right-handed parallel beta-helix repeat-containing protein, partial [Candidatus Bathyarchaeota archaeon]|nr:right-handed parallel beta-helix repeat-containing protein [Candidatus Bathyarchaeota archaeon]